MNAEQTKQQWKASEAGPIMVKRVREALTAMSREHSCRTELLGVMGVDEHKYSYYVPIGGGTRADVTAAWERVGAEFAWTITPANYKEIIAFVEGETQKLIDARPVIDKRITPEQDAANRTERETRERERTEQLAQKHAERDRLVEKLRAQYPRALPLDSNRSNWMRAAANLKAELVAAFPGVKFGVTSDYHSIRVEWFWGPGDKAVSAITSKYQYGHFDGMQDLYVADTSAFQEAVDIVLGSVKFISCARKLQPESIVRDIEKMICDKQHVPYQGPSTRNVFGEHDNYDVGEYAQRLIAVTDFPLLFEVKGLEDNNQSAHSIWEVWKLVVEAKPLPAVPPPAYCRGMADGDDARSGTEGGNIVQRNPERNGVEIFFASKPDETLRAKLKGYGFRTMKVGLRWKWYLRFSPLAWRQAHELAGLPVPAETDPAGAMVQAHENAVIDAQAEGALAQKAKLVGLDLAEPGTEWTIKQVIPGLNRE